ncbi:MAG: DNA-binding CsgD family transcriptional regulator [Kiritimatiellia bacterium]|jgi:DNA-binding CsgD family transcriptional regulator
MSKPSSSHPAATAQQQQVMLLRVNDDGVVVAASDTTIDQLGPCVGMQCHDVVRGVTPQGARHCTRTCAHELLQSGGDAPMRVVVDEADTSLMCSAMAGEVVVAIVQPKTRTIERPLSPRERQVMELIAQGLTNRIISRRLNISASTVRTHVEHLLEKLNARNRAEAVTRALETGQLT